MREGPMVNPERQMPRHVAGAYRDAFDLLYAAIFLISAHFFSRTDVARNWLGALTIAAFVVHWLMLHTFQGSIEKFRDRLAWVYRTYFSEEERLGLQLESRSYWYQPEIYICLLTVSFVGALLTAIYL
jgi:hypothetical protein